MQIQGVELQRVPVIASHSKWITPLNELPPLAKVNCGQESDKFSKVPPSVYASAMKHQKKKTNPFQVAVKLSLSDG